MFEYMTTQETAEKWEVSLRWVQRLCKENRVQGAINVNRVWGIFFLVILAVEWIIFFIARRRKH